MAENRKVVCIVGMTGSGKSVMSDFFAEKGFGFFRFGQITLDIVKERGLAPTEENEKPIREEIRKKHGMGAFAILNFPKIDRLRKKGHVIGDGLYSWQEYKSLEQRYGDDFICIAVYSCPKIRYQRLSQRVFNEKNDAQMRHRPAKAVQARARDFAEIENIEKGGPIAMAHHTIINENSLQEFRSSIEELYHRLF